MNSNTKRKVILVFLRFYLPGYRGGGPIRTIENLVDRLGEEFDFRIISSDRDIGDDQPYSSIDVDKWNQVGKAKVFYISPSSISLRNFARLMRETPHDVLYLNSFFDPNFTLTPLLAMRFRLAPRVPIVLAPRGEFSEGALKLKRWKKFVFIRFVSLAAVFQGVRFQASSEAEVADIKRVFHPSRSVISVANDISKVPNLSPSAFAEMEKTERTLDLEYFGLRICFLSRIAPMKNLDYAIKVLARVKVPVVFNIYGPKELNSYWEECEALIRKLPPNILVRYRGSVEHSHVRTSIAMNNLFFVPSRGENFGHVFIEALSAGVPILVSDRTPWRNLKKLGLGWDIPLDQQDDFVSAIEEAARFDAVQRTEISARCLEFARQRSEDGETVQQNKDLFVFTLSVSRSRNQLT